MSQVLKAAARETTTKSALKEMRAQGQIPGVVYGKNRPSAAIQVSMKDLFNLLKSNSPAVINLELPGGSKEPVMINHVQKDPLKGNVLHIDFHQIQMDEPVRAVVSVEFVGEPVGVKEGGVLQVQYHEIEIRCLPNLIPDSIKADISGLEIGGTLRIADLQLSDEIESRLDQDEVIVSILAPQKETTEESAGDTEGEAAESSEQASDEN